MSTLACHEERCFTINAVKVRIGLGFQKKINNIRMSIMACHEERCYITISAVKVGICIGFQKTFGCYSSTKTTCPQQTSQSLIISSIRTGVDIQ